MSLRKETMEPLKLYEIPKESKIKGEYVDTATGQVIGDMATFHHLDGMYSFCTIDGVEAPNNVIHLSAVTPLLINEDGSYSVDVREEPEEEND